jgi:hypothetical protein
MKIINIHRHINTAELFTLLQEKLNPLFQQQKQSSISFYIENTGNFVEISEPSIYEGFLFRIEINGTELWITRSEHYVDDVNSLTLESVLNALFEELSGDKGVSLTLEG